MRVPSHKFEFNVSFILKNLELWVRMFSSEKINMGEKAL